MQQREARNIKQLELAKKIVLALLKGQKAQVFLFGSRAHGKIWPSSDIDIAIMPTKPLPHGLLSEIREALEESNLLYNVDLVDLTAVEPAFRKKIEEEGILWSS